VAQPEGPYYLMGFSAGGVISYELARQLERMGKRVAYVGIIDMDPPNMSPSMLRRNIRRNFFRQLSYFLRDLMPNSPKRRAQIDLKLGKRAMIIAQSGLWSLGIRVGDFKMIIAADAVVLPEARKRVWLAQSRAVTDYKPGMYGGKVTVFKGEGIPFVYPPVGEKGWERYAKGGADVFVVPGRIHGSQLRPPNVKYLAALATMLMRKADHPS
jgi:thioesterase domain-containing protein